MALSAKDRLLGMAQSAQNERDKRTQRLQAAIKGGTERQAIRQVGQAAGLVASNAANRVAQMSQTDQYRFNQDQTAANLESVQNNSDFQDVVSRTRGDIYLSGNVFTGDAQARNTVRDIQLLNRDESGEWAKDNFDNAVLYMTPEQQDTMLYYAGTNQWDKASEYLDSIRYRLNQQEMQALTERTREVSEANPLLGALTNISAGFLSPVAYGANAIQGIRNAITGENVPTDTNSDLFLGAQLSQASREGVSAAGERMPILGNIEVGGQNLGSFAAGIGLDLGRVVSRLPFGPAGALALSGAGAAGEQTLDILNRGGTQGQAALSGAASGLIEAATEKIGLDNLFSIFGRTGQQGLRSVLRSVARQAGIEASEEAISEVLNTVADTAIMRENSTYEQAISNYMAQGMTREEATGAANRDVLANTAWAAAGGALSGGLMGGGASAVNAMQNRVTLPTAEQGGRLPGGETVQTEQQTPTVQQNNAINLPTADEWLNGQISRRQPVIEFTENLNQEQSQALGRMMSSGQVSVDADNNLYQVQEENHIDQRDMGTVGDKRVKAFQFDNPTLHDYFSGAAQDLLNDLADTVPAERWSTEVFNPYSGAVETVWNGTRRVTTDQIATLKDDQNLSYADIQQAAEAIIRNHGQENYAAAKRVEMVLDDMLTNGYTSPLGEEIPPNEAYIQAKRQIPGAYVPEETGPDSEGLPLFRDEREAREMGYSEPVSDALSDRSPTEDQGVDPQGAEKEGTDMRLWLPRGDQFGEGVDDLPIYKQTSEGNAIKVYRGFNRSKDPLQKNLATTRTIYDVIGKGGSETELIPLEYYTRDYDDALHYASHDIDLLNRLIESKKFDYRGKIIDGEIIRESEGEWAEKEAKKTYEILTGRPAPDVSGNVDEFFIRPNKVLDLSNAGERATIYEIYKVLSEQTGISEYDLDDELTLGDISDSASEGDAIDVFRVLRNSGNSVGSRFYAMMKRLGYDAVKYLESGSEHYAIDRTSEKPGDIQEEQSTLPNTSVGAAPESEVPPVVQRLSQALGRNIQMYDGSRESGTRGTANGYYSNGTIYVNSNTANPVAQVIAHELTHSVEMADAYQDLQNLIFERIQQTGGNLEQMRAQKADLYQRNGVNLNAQDLDAEIVAEYVEKNLLTDESSIQELTRTNRTLAQRIRDWIDSILAKLGNTDAQSRVFLERARDAYSRALQQTQGTVDTVATVDTVGSVASQRQVQSLLDQYDSGAITQEQLIERATRLLEGETQYSISETDSDGNALTSEQWAYFQNSKVVDENGNLLVMYHGTNANKDFTVFDTYGGNFGLFGVGSYFTDNADVARSYTKKGRGTNERVYSVYLNIKNPLDMDAPFDQSAWKLPSEVQDYVRDAKTNEEAYRGLKEYCQDEGMYKWEAEEYLFDIVSDQFDGITHVGGGRYGSKDGPRHRVYIAFSPEQIKRVDNLSPTTSPDIRYSLDENQRNQFISMLREYARGNWNEQTIQEYLNLVRQNGEYDQGANAARPVLVPQRDSEGNPVSRTARTAMGAKAIPESVASDIANLVRTGQMSYERVGDKASTQRAIQRIQNDGFDRSLEYFSQNVRKGIASKDMVTLGQQLLVNAANAGDGRRTAEILQLYTQMGTSIGQAEQAFSILRKLDPSDQLYAIQKTVSNLEEEIQKRFKDKNITIDPALLEEFQNQTDDAGRDAVKDKIYQNVADQIPSNWRDKWNAWRYMAMLVNPRTHIRNVAGNLLFQPVRMVKDKVAATMETFVHAINPNFEKTKSFVANPDLYRAAWSDFKNVKDILSGNKYDDIRSEINSRRTVFGGVLGKPFEAVRTGNSWALEAEDIIFKRLTYADALSGYLQSRGVTGEQLRSGNVDSNLLSAARDYAGQEALKATYQDKNQFSDLLSRRFQENNTAGKVANAAIDAVLPFRRTPANILVRGFEYSPLGLAKSLTADLVQVKRGNMSGAQAIDNIAAGLTGSGLFALGAMLLAQGIVTSGGDESEEQNDLNDLTGKQNYALNLPGGGSVTLDWLAPESLPFFMGVEFMDALGEGGSVMETITSALTSISEPMLELSMLQSLNDLIDSVSFAESSGKLVSMAGSALISYLTQAIPTLGGQIERTTEENRMSSFTDRNSSVPRDVQYAISRSSARLPGDYQQIPYIDAWGRTESSGNILERAFNNLLNPAYTSTVNQTAADEEIQRLLDAGMTGVVPDRVSQSQKVDDQYMTANEYVEYATTRGQTSYEIVSDMIDSDLYQSMTDEQKADAIKRAYQYASHVAAETIHPGHESEAYVTEAQQADSAAEYLLLYEKYGSSGTKRYSELMDAGLDGEAAETVLDTMDGLTGDVTSIQRYRAIVDSGISESDQMAALSQYMTESEYRKLSAGYDYGVSPDDYITFRETLPSFDENGNGSFTQAETEAALNSLSGSGLILPGFTGVNLTNDQKAVLWQLQGSNWSWRNNPYNTAIGRQVYNLLNQEEGSGFSGLLTLPTA